MEHTEGYDEKADVSTNKPDRDTAGTRQGAGARTEIATVQTAALAAAMTRHAPCAAAKSMSQKPFFDPRMPSWLTFPSLPPSVPCPVSLLLSFFRFGPLASQQWSWVSVVLLMRNFHP